MLNPLYFWFYDSAGSGSPVQSLDYKGDFPPNRPVHIPFLSVDNSGRPSALTNASAALRSSNGTLVGLPTFTPSNPVVGFNFLDIDTTGLPAGDYVAFVKSIPIAQFSIANRTGAVGGVGSIPVVCTITDSLAVAVAGAIVTAWQNGLQVASGVTDSNGHVALVFAAGTYSVAVSASGFNGSSSSIAISDTTPRSITLSRIGITPSPTGLTTGWLMALVNGIPAPGIVHTRQLILWPSGTGISVDGETDTAVSDGTGLVQFRNHVPGATYLLTRLAGSNSIKYVAQSADFQLPDCLG